MSKIIAVHQPNYIPWAGFFYKIIKSDVFVLLDNVQFSRRSFTHRNRIKGSEGNTIWLTVPVYKKGRFYQKINEVMINRTVKWQKKHFGSLLMNYANAPFFHYYKETLKEIFSRDWELLVDLNVELLIYIMKELKIEKEIHRASEMKIKGEKTELLISIIKELDGDIYLSGAGGRNYLDEGMFKKENIKILYYQYGSFIYPQLWGKFIPNLSICDVLFNCGVETRNMIERKWGYEKA
ncbi:WbqC family protein [candidate division WOR-3 bacterium]|nr:WbqC family protein [candidate division WOR-3 bacterium]